MNNFLLKIISIIGTIAAIFFAGFKSGKNKQRNKQLTRSVNNVKKAKNIENNIAKLSRDDKLKRL
jgi:Na+/H+ antiporter NhaC